MGKEWSLERTVQCAKCPWKVTTNPLEIPDGYSVQKHQALSRTIASGNINIGSTLKIMACHESEPYKPTHCIGWLDHQLGKGNNIGLRLSMRHCTNAIEVTTVGEQHLTFEDTLPK